MSKSRILYTWNENIPEFIQLEAQAQRLKEAYDMGIAAIRIDLKTAEERYKQEREKQRDNAEFIHILVGLDNSNYYVKRSIITPVLGDTDFNKDRDYQPFRVVNGVFISGGSGYYYQQIKNGDVVPDDFIATLDKGNVPEILKDIDKKTSVQSFQ